VLRQDYEPQAPRRDPARLLALVALAVSLVALAVNQAGRLGHGLAFAAGAGVALFALWLAALGLVRGLRRFFPRRLPYVYRQGLANLYRPANQTLLVVLALGFGTFLLSTLLLVQHNLLPSLLDAFRDRLRKQGDLFNPLENGQQNTLQCIHGPMQSSSFKFVPIGAIAKYLRSLRTAQRHRQTGRGRLNSGRHPRSFQCPYPRSRVWRRQFRGAPGRRLLF
jgi:hypothetical protein